MKIDSILLICTLCFLVSCQPSKIYEVKSPCLALGVENLLSVTDAKLEDHFVLNYCTRRQVNSLYWG